MSYKMIGAVFIITGCSGFGFSMALKHQRQGKMLQQLLIALQYMENELQYHLTPLPELCRQTSKEVHGALSEIFQNLARELDWQAAPDVPSCMRYAIQRSRDISDSLRRHLVDLGNNLGKFDLPGQLQGLQTIQDACKLDIERLEKDRDIRLRSYRTLGICAGAALAIILA